jgi:hypothetical protein
METLATVKTEQNISIIQNSFADFAKGNIPGITDACTDNVEWRSFDNPAIPYATAYQGKKGVAEFFATLAGSIEYQDFQTKEFFAAADKVFVKGYHKAVVKSTGKPFGHDFLMEFQLRNGKISSFFAWVDTRDQTEAFTK